MGHAIFFIMISAPGAHLTGCNDQQEAKSEFKRQIDRKMLDKSASCWFSSGFYSDKTQIFQFKGIQSQAVNLVKAAEL